MSAGTLAAAYNHNHHHHVAKRFFWDKLNPGCDAVFAEFLTNSSQVTHQTSWVTIKQEQPKSKSPPRKLKNADRASHNRLTAQQIEQLIEAARCVGRHGHRDATLIQVAFNHALRVGEAVSLRWSQVNFAERRLDVHRLNKGKPSKHAIPASELEALEKLRALSPTSEYVFCSERGGPLNRRSVLAILVRAGKVSRLGFPVHPHMIRHARGYELASKGIDIRTIQDFMGHRNIQHTAIYTQNSTAELFKFDD